MEFFVKDSTTPGGNLVNRNVWRERNDRSLIKWWDFNSTKGKENGNRNKERNGKENAGRNKNRKV